MIGRKMEMEKDNMERWENDSVDRYTEGEIENRG